MTQFTNKKRRDCMKRRISLRMAMVLFVLLFAAAGDGSVSAKADSRSSSFWNYSYDLISIDESTVSTTSNGEKATVLIFGRPTCPNTQYTINSLATSIWGYSSELRIVYADIDDSPKEDVQAFASLYGNGYIDFCYSAIDYYIHSIAWDYLDTAGITGSVTLPVVVLIDENDIVQSVMTNRQNADDIISEIEKFTTLTVPDDPYDTPGTPTEMPDAPSYSTPPAADTPTVEISYDKYASETSGGAETANVHNNEYSYPNFSQPVRSYVSETYYGYMRVEADSDKVYVEKYSYDYKLLDAFEIDMELPLFGGFYSGADYNFIVYGQENPGENDSVEIMRVVKYDKEWNRISSGSVYGANTSVPFDAGSLRMTESQGMLYIHTCHKMYMSDDGLNHQANMTYVLNEYSMDVMQRWYGIMNINYGYVSHSFNQFVATDGTYIYRLDHGDAYPRSIVVTKANVSDIKNCAYREIFDISGETGDNYTGVAVGGFELAGGSLVAAFNSVDQYGLAHGTRNIYVASTDTGLSSTRLNQLTYYDEDSGITVGNPHLVKASDDRLYVLWEESDEDASLYGIDRTYTAVKIAEINARGDTVGAVHTIYADLSDCKPIYTSDGEIVWYTTGGASPIFYHVSVDRLDKYEFAGRIDIGDSNAVITPESFEYTDYHEYVPDVKLTYGSYALREGRDYTVTFSNNYGPGTATVTVNGRGMFAGTAEYNFSIVNAAADNQGGNNPGNPGGSNPGSSSGGNSGSGSGSNSGGLFGGGGSSGGSYTIEWSTPIRRTRTTTTTSTSYTAKKPGKAKKIKVYRMGGTKLYVTWDCKTVADGFQLQYSTKKSFAGKKTKKATTSARFIKVKKGKTYYIRVRAYNKTSTGKLYGKWSKVKKIKIKK